MPQIAEVEEKNSELQIGSTKLQKGRFLATENTENTEKILSLIAK